MGMRKRLRLLWALDYRSLAVFRILLAMVLLGDLFVRSRDITAHYTDFGVVPRSEIIQGIMGSEFFVSLHLISGSSLGQAILFILAACFLIGMLLGVRTRLCHLVSWGLLCSLHTRNPYVLHAGDTLLRMITFWLLFLPTAKVWSIDALKRPPELQRCASEQTVSSIATFAFMWQLVLVYLIGAQLKNGSEWTHEYTALYYALNLETLVTPLGAKLGQYFTLCQILTCVTVCIQKYGLLFLIVPFFISYCRVLVIVLFSGFHLAIGLTFKLGLFVPTCLIVWSVLTPSFVWNYLERQAFFISLKKILKTCALKAPFDTFYRTQWATGETPQIYRKLCPIVVCFLLAYVSLWNVKTLHPAYKRSVEVLPQEVSWLGYILRLDQHWNMFAPSPTKKEGWFTIPAMTLNGQKIDLLHGGEQRALDKSSLMAAPHKNLKWQTLMLYLNHSKYSRYCAYYGQYLIRQWNQTHSAEQRIKSMQIVFMKEVTPQPGATYKPLQKKVLWSYDLKTL